MATLVMLAAVPPPTQLPAPWRKAPEPALPLDALGRSGPARLVSPYPDPGLRRLERGTLLLVFRRAA